LQRAEITGPSRDARLFRARAAVTLIARTETTQSFAQIGAVLGRRDHSTVRYQLQRAGEMQSSDPAFRLLLGVVTKRYRREALS
jgi:chromosomal replication initiation ATPase DnaA